MILLDAAATTPVRRSALEAAWPYLTGVFGNPSSVHEPGLAAARGLTAAREGVAEFLGCRPAEVIFTSGGTEGANLCIKGLALASPRGRHLVTTRIEHEAVLESVAYLKRAHGFTVGYVETDATGLVSADALRSALHPDTALVSIGWANNEVGTVQDITELASVAHEFGALFHTDAVQAVAALPVDVRALGVDALSFSGHKLGAPKGSGAVFARAGLPLEPLLHGGGQERGRRSGTENVAWAVALRAALSDDDPVARRTRDAGRAVLARGGSDGDDGFETLLRSSSAMGGVLTGHPTQRLPRHASFVFPGINGETVLLELERRGIVASAGSACAAGRTEPSHVLLALGYTPDEASAALRFTWTADITAEQLREASVALAESVAAVRRQ
ncbi:cysteine desulfurase family protein [Gryllotalpicola protaetiae]|uniref:cysteine desulfurase n=1 Tax=Gryllotalpicola protaetiae TaxID=2419771 RepID=A0A387BMA7_9MICO|nr:cysteine desulfurase family protein [Gryllotalpicola protaetiae]AYG03808.1 cysteine desulfurase [Gryllotalpicola protaetiae]